MSTPKLSAGGKQRLATLNKVIADKTAANQVEKAFKTAGGNWAATLENLKAANVGAATIAKADLAHSLAVTTNDNAPLVQSIMDKPGISTMRDVALNHDATTIAALLKPAQVPAGTPGNTPKEQVTNAANTIYNSIFSQQRSAVLQRMATTGSLPIADGTLRGHVATFLGNVPDFNIGTTSIYHAINNPAAFNNIPAEAQAPVMNQMKQLQRVQAISPTPNAVAGLIQNNVISAQQVAEMTPKKFQNTYADTLGPDTAAKVYNNAVNLKVRNEQALMAIKETVHGSGVQAIDGKATKQDRVNMFNDMASKNAAPITWEGLFGSVDLCECEDCNSVYGPASYFVELLNFLRNDNLNPDTTKYPNTGQTGIDGTPLQQLFRRRPDLGCLELTCANANTVMPYIDIVNEIMESFIIHEATWDADTNTPKQLTLDVWNVEGESTSDLLAQPQHTNYNAYCVLKSAVYPFTLPYHQPIDAIRIFLNYLKTSRYELMDTFRSLTEADINSGLPAAGNPPGPNTAQLETDIQTAIDRGVDAEFLGMTQEEYIILTKQAFWELDYFNLTCNQPITEPDYQTKIGVRNVWEYYGYGSDADMISLDETAQTGLTFVQKQFLVRTGLLYTDLVNLLETQFINPYMLQGQALDILDSLTFSYRYLQNFVTTKAGDPGRFDKLIAFLQGSQLIVPALQALLHSDPCHQTCDCNTISDEDIGCWVKCYFDQVGKLIVLDSGDEPKLPFSGKILIKSENRQYVNMGDWQLTDYGQIYLSGTLMGKVMPDGTVIGNDGKPITDKILKGLEFAGVVVDSGGRFVGGISGGVLYDIRESGSSIAAYSRRNDGNPVVQWLPVADSCDLSRVRLIHLDGSPLTDDEYDKIQRFIRLWRKMGWTMDETDKALIGLGNTGMIPPEPGQPVPAMTAKKCFGGFEDDCTQGKTDSGCDCSDESECECADSNAPYILNCDITPWFLHQLVFVNKLLDSTGLTLDQVLTFWGDIGTIGDNSLYQQLFLTYNLLDIDTVFQADKYGNYLTTAAKITDHIPVLMAAFNLKAADITNIMQANSIADSLTLENVSMIYRYKLLMNVLSIASNQLKDVKTIFGDPFTSASQTENFVETWGKMEDYDFTFNQLDYVINNTDDPARPQKPSFITFLKLSKTFYDGLNAIITANPDVNTQDGTVPAATVPVIATATFTAASLALLFTPEVTQQIMALLQGTTVYSTNAPQNLVTTSDDFSKLLSQTATQTLIPKIKYDFVNGGIQVTGILTPAEIASAKALFAGNNDWAGAIDRTGTQAVGFFADVLYGIISDPADQATMLQGDENTPDPQTAPAKLFCFMKAFMPFLRERLMHTFIVDTLATQTGLDNDVTDMLISEVLMSGTPFKPIVEVFKNINNAYQPAAGTWGGYLIPTSTDSYTFAIEVSTGNPLTATASVNGQALVFTQQADPNNVYLSQSVKLQSGRAYKFQVNGLDVNLTGLTWKTATTPRTAIPSSVMLVDDLTDNVVSAYVELQKASIVVSGYDLTADEISYLQTNGSDFGGLDFNSITLATWLRLGTYTRLRNSLPTTNLSLIQFFAWAKQNTDATQLSAQIAAMTLWGQGDVDKLIAADHFNMLNDSLFANETGLLQLQQALYVAAKINIDINLLFDWAKPTSKFWICHDIAESIRKSIKARYNETDWEQVVKPLNDTLREHQRDALIAYLLVQADLIAWGVVDANSLFEFFLIDVQMDSCMETSRIKQGTLSVQLYVQRCFLGLEEPWVANDALDAVRWLWMQNNNVWVANRKVFLYPENWIDESLRDDKSVFYKQLESELLQKDINTANVTDALNNYLFSVDDVANMRVVGLFTETAQDGTKSKHHIFSRTRNAPYFFYYRYFDITQGNWYPWEQVQVDIPSFDKEDPRGYVIGNGVYLTPVVWNGRLLIFFPQFLKKTTPPDQESKSVSYSSSGGDGSATATLPNVFWEIKLAWSEYRNGKWTQKQVSKDSIVHGASPGTSLPDISQYNFIAGFTSAGDGVQVIPSFQNNTIASPLDGSQTQTFMFQGSTLFVYSDSATYSHAADFSKWDFQSKPNGANENLYLLQLQSGNQLNYESDTSATDETNGIEISLPGLATTTTDFYHSFSHQLLGLISSGSTDDFFNSATISDLVQSPGDAYGSYLDTSLEVNSYGELKAPYAIYNWELFFHTPATIAGKLSSSQQFQNAKQWYEYIFNPGASGSTPQRAWQFYPFRKINADNYLEYLFNTLQANTSNQDISAWRDNPFEPHLIARGRPVAYMKWTVMQYLDNLIAWGDYLFTQHTLESINQATQLYILAYHVMGPRPQVIPKRGKIQPETYNSLMNKWDAFGNAMVEMELAFPFSNQIDTPIEIGKSDTGFANIFGYATSLYFCLPGNPQLLSYWDTLDDRLGKIRACENIEGIFSLPPLWDPPIDPALLVAATAQGISISSVLNDLDSPVPNYRFNYLLQKAMELCNELKSLGSNLLSAFEKADSEVLAKMRASQEVTMQNLVMQMKQLVLNEANAALDGLNQNRLTPVYRMQYYLNLINQDLSKVPDTDTDYAPIQGPAQVLATESELILNSYEQEEMDKASQAHDWQTAVGAAETIAGILHLIPHISVDGKPLGVGGGLAFGGQELGLAAEAVAKGLQIKVGDLNFQSSTARSKGGYLRQLQDRVLQANLAGYEIKQIDKQILSQQIRIDMANQEITNQQQAIDNAQQVADFLTNKYTNQELYTWMQDSLKTLYYQVYTLAYGLAQKAEKVYRFERGLSSSNFIQFGYWDAGHDGLLAGENLYVGLKQLEAAYQQDRGYDYEITKQISLRQIDPIALLNLREAGTCQFTIPEILFDMDFPGHYMRRIRSVSMSIPCVAGPYTGINATLRLMQSTFRQNNLPGSNYPQDTTQNDLRFATVNVPLTSIAVSHGQNDSGVFELNFKDERYMPFEGAGAISTWSLSLPEFKQIDYNTINDVIITMRYTSVDGGGNQSTAASAYITSFIKSVNNHSQDQGLFAIFDLKNDFPNEWYKATQLPPTANGREFLLNNLADRLPVYVKNFDATKTKVTDVYAVTDAQFNNNAIKLLYGAQPNPTEVDFDSPLQYGKAYAFPASGQSIPLQNWDFCISDTVTPLNNFWLVVRYTLSS